MPSAYGSQQTVPSRTVIGIKILVLSFRLPGFLTAPFLSFDYARKGRYKHIFWNSVPRIVLKSLGTFTQSLSSSSSTTTSTTIHVLCTISGTATTCPQCMCILLLLLSMLVLLVLLLPCFYYYHYYLTPTTNTTVIIFILSFNILLTFVQTVMVLTVTCS